MQGVHETKRKSANVEILKAARAGRAKARQKGRFMDYTAIGKRVRIARHWQDMTQEQVAELMGISVSFIGHIERGTRKLSVETLHGLCTVLCVSSDYLLGLEDEEMQEKKYAPQERYIKDNIRRFVLNVNKNTEADLMEHLEGQKNVQKYIRDLIRADMEKQGRK